MEDNKEFRFHVFFFSFVFYLGALRHKSNTLPFNSIRKAINLHYITLILQLKLMFQATIFYNMLSLSSLLSEYEVIRQNNLLCRKHRTLILVRMVSMDRR